MSSPDTAPAPPADEYAAEDATDRRVALSAATEIVAAREDYGPYAGGGKSWLELADKAYDWLRARRTLATSISIVPGTPVKEQS